MISQTAEYALRAITHLALTPDAPQTSQQIAAGTVIPAPYVSKVMQSLVRAEIVQAQRGLHGGFTLRKPAEKLTIYEIVQAVDPLKRIKTCPLGLESHGSHLCPLHHRLDEALAMTEKAFRDTTIADLLNEPTTDKPLCPFPIISASSITPASPEHSESERSALLSPSPN